MHNRKDNYNCVNKKQKQKLNSIKNALKHYKQQEQVKIYLLKLSTNYRFNLNGNIL